MNLTQGTDEYKNQYVPHLHSENILPKVPCLSIRSGLVYVVFRFLCRLPQPASPAASQQSTHRYTALSENTVVGYSCPPVLPPLLVPAPCSLLLAPFYTVAAPVSTIMASLVRAWEEQARCTPCCVL